MRKINIGCEDHIIKGFENYDIIPFNKEVKFLDLNKRLPFKDKSIDHVLLSHVLEHLNNPMAVLKEIHRVCKKGATIKIHVPHFSHFTNYADMTHVKCFSYFSLGYEFTNKSLYHLFEVETKLNFNRVNYKWMNLIMNPLINAVPILYERFFCYIFPCSEIQFELEVI